MGAVEPRPAPSLRRQLLSWLLPPFAGVLAISFAASYTLALRFATEAYDTALFDSARSLAQQIRFGTDGVASINLPRAATEILVSDPYDHIYYRVLSPENVTVAGSDNVPLPAEGMTRSHPVLFYDALIAGEPVRVGAYAVFGTDDEPSAVVLFAETRVKRDRLSRNLLFTMLLPLVALSFVVVVGVGVAVRRALEPLQRIALDLSRRGWSNLAAPHAHAVPAEIRPLTDALDDLLHRLSTALSAQSRFISEAAHQLRTPMAGLSSQTERALAARDIDAIKPALAQLLVSARRTTRLVNQLLTLARTEPGGATERGFEQVDLAALVQRTCMEWVPEALHQDVDLGYVGPATPVMIEGDDLLLAEMLNNLIDNALRYGVAGGGIITVRLAVAPTPEVVVEDDGAGIPEGERERVFERFHRVPGSATGGSGLGLAIVREIARSHHAEVRADVPESGRGTAIRIRFLGGADASANGRAV